MRACVIAAGVVIVLGTAVSATDWPQWQGPDRTRLSKETGLLKEWPKPGPKLLWQLSDIGEGYSIMFQVIY